MFITKAKRLTEALAKSDALKIPRSEIFLMTVSDGIELYTLTDNIKPRGIVNFLVSYFCL